MSSDPNAEREVKRLARLPQNTTCPNCGASSKFGFSTVCIKFHTFVCNDCKSSHQAVSHRCKSLTMSSWSAAEVSELKRKGNDFARATWLADAPPVGQGGRPRAGVDSLASYKRFVVDTYERRRYYGDNAVADETMNAPPSSSSKTEKKTTKKKAVLAPRAPAPPKPQPPPVVEDLLSFGFDDARPTSNDPRIGTEHVATATPATPTLNLFGNDDVSPTRSAQGPPRAAAPSASTNDFGHSNSNKTTNLVFDPFASSDRACRGGPAPSSSSAISNSSFSSSTSPATAAAATTTAEKKRPVMNGLAAMNGAFHVQQQQKQQQNQQQQLQLQQQMFMMRQRMMMMQQQQQQPLGTTMMNNTTAAQQQQQQQQQAMMMSMMQQQQQAMRLNNVSFGGSLNGANIDVPQTYSSSSRKDDPFAGL